MMILLVDDDVTARELLADHLEKRLGHHVTQCGSGRSALELFTQNPFPMVLSDIRMPRMDGIELLQSIKALPEGRFSDIVLLTGYGNMESAIQALRAGAYDYLLKPVNLRELEAAVSRIAEHQSLLRDNYELSHRFEDKLAEATRETEMKLESLKKAYAEIVGIGKICVNSQQMRKVVAITERLHLDRTVPVLIEGETGTGKEVVASLVHYGRVEVTAPFISINCSALPSNLFESELFGYEGGAFSGAKKSGQMGKFELAQGGTLLLDEIGDMPLEMQPKLLRILEEREFYRVGGLKKIKLDIRIICTTNRDLERQVKEGAFREDLFFRLNIARIHIPPLRERVDDIAPLVQMFLEFHADQKKRRFKSISNEALSLLENHSWPGNVRQLQNAIERVLLLHDEVEIRPEHLTFLSEESNDSPIPPDLLAKSDLFTITLPPDGLELKKIETWVIEKVLSMFNGNKTRTAAYLGVARNSLRNKLNRVS